MLSVVTVASLVLNVFKTVQGPQVAASFILCALDAVIAPSVAILFLVGLVAFVLWLVDRMSSGVTRVVTERFLGRVHQDHRTDRLIREGTAGRLREWLAEEYPEWACPVLAERLIELLAAEGSPKEG